MNKELEQKQIVLFKSAMEIQIILVVDTIIR